jgi:hypothetical protein
MTKTTTGALPDWGQTVPPGRSRGLLAFFRRRQGAADLRAIDAIPLGEGEHLRLWNITEGLTTTVQIAPPQLFLVRSEDCNAFALGGAKPGLGFTTGMLDTYTRTELEAVVAHGVARLVRAGRGRVGEPEASDDISAAALTRYPPALASALRKSTPRPDGGAIGWFVPEGGGASAESRAQAVLDL